MCAAIADGHRYVLFTTHCERHWGRPGNIVEADAPQFLASLIVVRAEPAVNRSAEDQPSRGGENPGGLRRTLTLDKNRLPCLEIRCLNASVPAIAIQKARGLGSPLALDENRLSRLF